MNIYNIEIIDYLYTKSLSLYKKDIISIWGLHTLNYNLQLVNYPSEGSSRQKEASSLGLNMNYLNMISDYHPASTTNIER